MISPLGKYTEIVSALIALGIIAAAAFGHLTGRGDLQFLDNIALIAVGAIFGAKSAANGYAAQALAAHKRLDKIGAPAADDTQIAAA